MKKMSENIPIPIDFFDNFDMQRICIDRCQIVIYDKKYSMGEHYFDIDLANTYLMPHMKRSKIGKRFEDVVRYDNKNSSIDYEIRLRGSRAMLVRTNIIRYYKLLNNIETEGDILHEDNFFPVDIVVPLKDQVELLYGVIEDAKEFYYNFVKEWWGYDCKNIEAKLVVVELPYEIYPANVPQLLDDINLSGHVVTHHDTQSQTIYFQEKDAKSDDSIYRHYNDIQISVNKLKTDIGKIQFKIYQKSWGLVRMEHTVYANDLKYLFRLKKYLLDKDVEHITLFLKNEFVKRRILPKRFLGDYEESLRYLSEVYKFDILTLDNLSKISVWESSKANRGTTQKLLRKKLIKKLSRGIYEIDPHFKDLLNSFPNRVDILKPPFIE
jgi:hypothetical protein